MARYLVTGGCGFIGSHLVDALVAQGDRVIVLDNLSTGTRKYVPSEAELVVGDICDAETVKQTMAKVDACFHATCFHLSRFFRVIWGYLFAPLNSKGYCDMFEIINCTCLLSEMRVDFISNQLPVRHKVSK